RSRSTSFSYAAGDSSRRNASTSSGVGGKPTRSRDSRRIKLGRSACSAGLKPSASRRAMMYTSIEFRGQSVRRTGGTGPARGSVGDPLLENLLVLLGQRQLGGWRRHSLGVVLGEDSGDHLAFIGVAGNDRDCPRGRGLHSLVTHVQPNARLPRLLVRSMALEAVPRQDRANLCGEVVLPGALLVLALSGEIGADR